jgi:hypothetical protein
MDLVVAGDVCDQERLELTTRFLEEDVARQFSSIICVLSVLNGIAETWRVKVPCEKKGRGCRSKWKQL